MDNKVGVYICSGCDISKSLNIEKLLNIAKNEYKVEVCISHEFLCGKEGSDLIKSDIADKGINKVVIAACSMRAKQDIFNYDILKIYTERVNLREHVIWISPSNNENTQRLAEDYLRMGITKAKKAEPPEPLIEEINKSILVIGGGVSGLNAATNAAMAGYNVVLVEKESHLGGFPYSKYKKWETNPPFEKNVLISKDLDELIQKAENSDRIKIYKSSVIKSIFGQPGMFDVAINGNEAEGGNGELTERVGAVIEATGWKPYNPANLSYLGYGSSPDILTNVELEELYSKLYLESKNELFTINRPSNHKPVGSVAFILCAGSRDENHLPYCSTVCCMSSLKEAAYIRNTNPNSKVFIIYRDIRTTGEYENYYKKMQQDDGIFMVKGELSDISVDKSGSINIKVDKTLFGGSIDLNVEMAVLAAGIVPNSGDFTPNGEVALTIGEQAVANPVQNAASCAVPAGEDDFSKKSGILNLIYRQGKELPDLVYGFPDSNFVCFPYESRRTGIYPAGSVRQPMDVVFSADDAKGAVLKTIQCIELAAKGKGVHPRAGDMTYPFIDLPRCTQCRRCTVECPFGALDENDKGTPKLNPKRCRRCGVCMGACPVRIISFKNYSVDIIGSMIKAMNIPEEGTDENLRIVVFACENDSYPALDIAGIKRLNISSNIRVIPVRCLGSINNVWYADALSRGIDGILLLGCRYGDDYQCHFIKGSELASYRMANLKETLDRLVLESERVKQVQLEISDYQKLPEIVEEFVNTIKKIGPSPYKGF